MRSLSNLLKSGYVNIDQNDVRIIDYNKVLEEKIDAVYHSTGQIAAEYAVQNAAEALFAEYNAEGEDAFEGLQAPEVTQEVYNGPSPEEIAAQAQAEAEALLREAEAEAEQIRQAARAEGRQQGYEEGRQQGYAEADSMKAQVLEQQKKQEAMYDRQLEQIEPMMVETLMGIYRHIFQVDVSHYNDIVTYLLEKTLRNIEGSRDFLVHVSKEEYPAVSAHKKQLMDAVSMNNVTFEVIEDLTLRAGECLIETEGGIFDCGIGTQLEELERELRILSYKK